MKSDGLSLLWISWSQQSDGDGPTSWWWRMDGVTNFFKVQNLNTERSFRPFQLEQRHMMKTMEVEGDARVSCITRTTGQKTATAANHTAANDYGSLTLVAAGRPHPVIGDHDSTAAATTRRRGRAESTNCLSVASLDHLGSAFGRCYGY